MFPWSADHVNGNLPVVLYSRAIICDGNTYIYTVFACTLNSRLLSEHLGVIAVGDFFSPSTMVRVGVQLTRLRRLNQGTLTSICVRKNLNATVLQVTCTCEFFLNSCTGISRRGKTCQYSTAVVVLTFCI